MLSNIKVSRKDLKKAMEVALEKTDGLMIFDLVLIENFDRFEGVVGIGENEKIGKNGKIGNSVIGSICEIGDNCEIINSVIWNGTKIKDRARLTLDVVGYHNSQKQL